MNERNWLGDWLPMVLYLLAESPLNLWSFSGFIMFISFVPIYYSASTIGVIYRDGELRLGADRVGVDRVGADNVAF